MAIYISLMIFALSGYAFNANRNEKTRQYYLWFVFGMIVLVAALRSDQIGIDLTHYYNKYYPLFKDVGWSNLQKVTVSGDWEWGFCAFCKVIGQISTNTQCFVFFTGLFTIVPYGIFIYKNSDDVVFSTVFFLGYHIYMMSMNVVRQAMAVGVILIGLEALKRKRYIKFLLYVVVATLFHSSAIIAILLIVCDKLPFKKNTFYVLGALTVGFSATYRVVFERLLNISALSNLYGIYSATGSGDSGGYITFHTFGMFAIAMAMFIYCYMVYDSKITWHRPYCYAHKNKKVMTRQGTVLRFTIVEFSTRTYWSESMLMYATYFAVLFRFSAFIINVTARFSLYFIPFLMIAFPHALNKIQPNSNKKIAISGVLTVVMIFFLYLGFTRAGAMWGTVPYQFFWE